MSDPVGADGGYGSKSWDMTPYWKCPKCGEEAGIDQRMSDTISCPECGLEGELMVKWRDYDG